MTTHTKSITLNPGESGPAEFTITPTAAGIYQVNVNGLTGSFKVIAPAEFEISDLIIRPSLVDIGEPVNISVMVRNTGGTTGTATITLVVT